MKTGRSAIASANFSSWQKGLAPSALPTSSITIFAVFSADKRAARATRAAQCAVIDLGLPDIDGYEVARQLRLDPRTRSIRLVAHTGSGQTADRELALAAGFDRHLTKPVNLDDLVAAL